MSSFENIQAKVQEIKDLEEVGDQIIHDIAHGLHRTFVTPIDREDILALAERLDDVVDAIEEAARYTLEYRIDEPTEYARQLTAIIVHCGDQLERATSMLHYRGGRLKEILPTTIELNRLEKRGGPDHQPRHGGPVQQRTRRHLYPQVARHLQ